MEMDKDLILIQTVRENLKTVQATAEKYIADRSIEGVALAINVLRVYTDRSTRSLYDLKYRSIYTDGCSFGECASEGHQKQLLHRISECHKQYIDEKHPVCSGSRTEKEMATKRITFEADEKYTVDALLAVYGCSVEKNQEFLALFSKNL